MNQIKQLHAHCLRTGVDETKDLLQRLLLIPNLVYARKLFDFHRNPCIFLYNSLIQAYSVHDQPHESILLYNLLSFDGIRPNHHTFNFIFAASASISSARTLLVLHSHQKILGVEVHNFTVEDKSHPKSYEIYQVLDRFSRRMKPKKSHFDSMLQHEQLCI